MQTRITDHTDLLRLQYDLWRDFYLTLPSKERSYAKVAAQYEISEAHVKKIAAREDWAGQAQRHDLALRRKELENYQLIAAEVEQDRALAGKTIIAGAKYIAQRLIVAVRDDVPIEEIKRLCLVAKGLESAGKAINGRTDQRIDVMQIAMGKDRPTGETGEVIDREEAIRVMKELTKALEDEEVIDIDAEFPGARQTDNRGSQAEPPH